MSEIALPLPPKRLMFNVAMTRDASEFLKVGERCAGELKAAAAASGLPMTSARRILDWGCGPCRTLRWLIADNDQTDFFGCDVDMRAIDWCLKNARQLAEFRVTPAKPPLPYADNFFDIIYGVSVFTHINANYQALWLAELRRIMKPGALLMLSLMGSSIGEKLPEPERSQFMRNGFHFVPSRVWKGIHSEWYADAFQSEQYVRDEFSKYLTIVAYHQYGMNGHQDLVVLRKDAG